MLIRCSLFPLLLVLSNAFDFDIDLARCKKDTACFVRGSCYGATEKELVVYPKDGGGDLQPKCDTIMQIKAFTPQKYHVMLLVRPDKPFKPEPRTDKNGQSIGDASVVTLSQGNVKITCAEGKSSSEHMKIVQHGKPIFAMNRMFCSFTMEDKNNPANPLTNFFQSTAGKPTITFKTVEEQKMTFATGNDNLWKETTAKCNPDLLKSKTREDGDAMLFEVDTTRDELKCPGGGRIQLEMDNHSPKRNVRVSCDGTAWKHSTTDDVPAGSRVHCERKFCSMCKSELEAASCEKGCSSPHFEEGIDDCVPVPFCDDDQWMVLFEGETEQEIVKGRIKCTKHKAISTSFWHLNNRNVLKASCYSKAKESCWNAAKLTESCPKGRTCKKVIKSSNSTYLSCPRGFKLKYSNESKVIYYVTRLSCNLTSEMYEDDQSRPVSVGTNVYCIKPVYSVARTAGTSALRIEFYSCVGGVLLVFIVFIISMIVFLVVKRRQNLKDKSPKVKSYQAGGPVLAVADAPPAPLPKAPDGPKTTWLKRERVKRQRRFDKGFWLRYCEMQFACDVLPNFAQLKLKFRKNVLYTLTALHAYCTKAEDRKCYGHLYHFFELVKHCEANQLDSLHTWECIFRFVRLLEYLVKKHIPGDTNNICDRMRTVMTSFARPIFDELGWKIAKGEDISDTKMRFLVLRILLWAEHPDIIAELTRQADLPFDKLESPIRAVVIGFAVRNLKRGEEMMKYWKTVMEDQPSKDKDKDRLGTQRQHLLFGLTMFRDAKNEGNDAEFKFMKEILQSLYDVSNPNSSFTPSDHYWAYLGATEHFSNVPTALAVYTGIAKSFAAEKLLGPQFEAKSSEMTPEEVSKLKNQWKMWIVDTMDMLAECCTTRKMYMDAGKTIARFERWLSMEKMISTHDSAMFLHRSTNLESLFAAKSAAEVCNYALKRIEHGQK